MLQDNIARLRRTYAERVNAMSDALREHLGDAVEFTAPGGGYFFWLNFTDGADADALLPLAQEHGVQLPSRLRLHRIRRIPQRPPPSLRAV